VGHILPFVYFYAHNRVHRIYLLLSGITIFLLSHTFSRFIAHGLFPRRQKTQKRQSAFVFFKKFLDEKWLVLALNPNTKQHNLEQIPHTVAY
jgi:hypothetical protein